MSLPLIPLLCLLHRILTITTGSSSSIDGVVGLIGGNLGTRIIILIALGEINLVTGTSLTGSEEKAKARRYRPCGVTGLC